MTVIAGSIGTAVVLLLAAFIVDLGIVSTHRARAQLAADAAALAAVAESGPYGDGLPEDQARRFAEVNGARLLDCACEPGATSMQVEVAVGGVVARARAVLEVDLLTPLEGSSHGGLHPRLGAAVERLIAASEGAVTLVSGYRAPAEQRRLWAEALARYGSPEAADDWVAPPGGSMHEKGLAVDLGGDLDLAARLVERMDLPVHRPLSNEPWHFELVGSR